MASTSGTKTDLPQRPMRLPPRKTRQAPTMFVDVSNEETSVMDSELVPTSLADIAPILRVANEIQDENPRVAYLCRFHALETAHKMDRTASGRGVRQFKTYLLHRLEKEEEETTPQLARNDPKEIEMFYKKFYEENIRKGQHTKKPEEMVKLLQIASVLYDVLRTVVPSTKVDEQTRQFAEDVKKKREPYERYNILPLYATGAKPVIMELPEIKAALHAVRNVQNLPIFRVRLTSDVPGAEPEWMDKVSIDILDWLSSFFGFQEGNVANQREHLILLLANRDIRRKNLANYTELSSGTILNLMEKIFKNYWSWCKYLRRESNIRTPLGFDIQQLQLIYIALYLLIWGEASNIRFMPECICYIFHHMASEVNEYLFSTMHSVTGATHQACAPCEERFLHAVITPIYQVLYKEAKKNNGGMASHSKWRNYDDLNEYFWFEKCFKLGWPMNLNADFFVYVDEKSESQERSNQTQVGKRKPKTNFVEARTFWHLYRSFDRMWIFFIMAFQAMVIIAWSPSGSLAAIFDNDVFRSLMSIFITQAFLNFLQASLDIILSFNAWKSLKFTQILWCLAKFTVAAVWVVVLPIGYVSSVQNPTGLVKFFSGWIGDWQRQSFYNYAVAIYLIPNMLAAIVFFLPFLRRTTKRSNWRIITFFMWWAQPKLYVGRGMHESMFSLLKYTLFWIMLLISKLAFSYYVEILPLVEPTKLIMKMPIDNYKWHEFFPNLSHNIGVVIAIWAPIVLVYFMDPQIWYAIYSTLFGGIHGALSHLGEMGTLRMLRSRFEAVPSAFCDRLVPSNAEKVKFMDDSLHRKTILNFSQMWNEFIKSMRQEDLLSDQERDLLLVPYSSADISVVQWPHFLLASKIPIALEMAKDFRGKEDDDLFKKIKYDGYMHSAIIECYETLRDIINGLLEDEADRMIVMQICDEVDISVQRGRFLTYFRMSGMPSLSDKLEKFLKVLLSTDYENDYSYKCQIIIVLQDVMEIITQDIMVEGNELLARAHSRSLHSEGDNKEQRFEKLNISPTQNKSWREKVVRLYLLLTVKESAIEVPKNLDARRRITFFANSLFMNMPSAPKVRDMLSFSVLTTYYKEDVLYSNDELNKENEDVISILSYLQKIYPDEWANFQSRINDPKLNLTKENKLEQTCLWVSYRGQTLSRTVRGMMNYRKALKLQCFLELAEVTDLGDYWTIDLVGEKEQAFAQALADMKFTYVVSCQVFDAQKVGDARDRSCYNNILKLMLDNRSLRVAYIDEREDRTSGESEKFYYSVLLKGGDKLDEEIYRIKLPGPPLDIGEGKPENQNHAIIFTRGEALQTIDMNQDNYFEEAFKMRNVLEEFISSSGRRQPTILGLREHIFTGSVSSPAWFMSNQETSFVTIGQRILANPLRVRFHYGHPDIFDRIFHITRGGISKASKKINLSQDMFAGYNSTLRGGYITHHEYIQVGKGHDVGMNQISLFEAKVANGIGEQTLSRDVYRLGRRFDFFRMLSFYFTTVGIYFTSMITVLIVYVFIYGRLYMVMTGLEKEILESTSIHQSKALEQALVTQSLFQLGMLLVLPMVMEIGLENGFGTALVDFVFMQLRLASVFFTFQLGTKAHYFGRTILHGGSIYQATGRGLVVFHAKFAENYRFYSRSHFVKGLELIILLFLHEVNGDSYRGSILYRFISFSMWFLVGSWLFAPFVFNPSGFDWEKTVNSWTDWKRWMGNRGGIGIQPDRSWESWWDGEQKHLKHTNIRGKILEIVLAFRFFIYQYGIVYLLHMVHHSKRLLVYGLSWALLVTALLVFKILSMRRRKFCRDFQLMFRILKALLFLGFMSVMTVLFVVRNLTIWDLFACMLAFLPTGWALLLIGQVCKGLFRRLGLWESIRELAREYDYMMGLVIFAPIAILSLFPCVSEIQTRLLLNPAFCAGRKD